MASKQRGEKAASLFNEEVLAETSASLGRAGGAVERTLRELKAFQGDPEDRRVLLKAATEAVYWYFVQREACGFPNQDEAIRLYEIPDEVLLRLGCL